MKVHTFPILQRFTYDPAMVTEHNTPLYDKKQAKPVAPQTTVRVGNRFLTPKQIVYILNVAPSLITPETPNPECVLPRYILHRDHNPDNILFENLTEAERSRRWDSKLVEGVGPSGPMTVPKHLLQIMTDEDMARIGGVLYE